MVRIFTLGLLVLANQTAAQNATLERIEVTAQKRPQSLQQVPVSVTALSNAQIEQFSIEDVQSIAAFTPNLTATRAISGVNNYFIRGVGLDDFNLSSVPAIGIYLDDVAIHNPMLANFVLHDVQRVEVLRGPQNALYGKNTTGGAIHFITTKTQNEFNNGYAKLSVGQLGQAFIDGASNLDLNENFSVRLSGFKHKRDGAVKSINEGNHSEFGNIDKQGIRVSLTGKLTDNWQLNMAFYGGVQRQIAQVKTVLLASDNGLININNANLEKNSSELIAPKDNIDAIGGFFKLGYEGSFINFSSLTAIEQVKSERMDDWGAQGNPASVYQSITYNNSDTFFISQEFQWQSNSSAEIQWLAGVAFNQSRGDLLQMAYIDPAGPGRPDDQVADLGVGPLFDRGALVKDDNTSYAIYAQMGLPINERLNFTAAYRWTRQLLTPKVHSVGMMMDLAEAPFPLGTMGWFSLGNPDFDIFTDYAGFKVAQNFVNEFGGYPASADIDKSFNEWGGKLALDYQVSPELLFYSSIARGFKMAAVNSNPTTAAYASMLSRVVEPESLITYELGFKSQWLENSVRINGAVFRNDWHDYQFYMVYNPGNPTNLFATLVNLPKAQSTGAELEVNWIFDEDFNLVVGLGWLDTKVTNGDLNTDGVPANSINAFQQQVIKGNELTNSPEWTFSAVLNKSYNFQGNELNLALHYNFIDEHIHILAGQHSARWQYNFSEQATHILGASARFHFGNQEQYEAILWGKNLTNEQYCMERAVVPGTDAETVRGCVQGQGRQVGFTFIYRFD